MNYSFENLKEDVEAELSQLTREMDAFPWENKKAYADWCAQTYFYVSHSTRLLALASAKCTLLDQDLHRRFIQHLSEEKGHESLALNDLKKLGFSAGDFNERTEISLFYQNQYYWLSKGDAKTIFGWIIALEGNAVHAGAPAFARVIKAHGHGTASFLKVHSAEDIEHLAQAFEQVEDLSSVELLSIKKNLKQSCFLYIEMLKSIKEISRSATQAA